ncbi:cell wall / vacuolar inhibitor of fructosidase 1-like [Lycium ferocissimum]|uniref:cell wall / vacuolar inhibitor of fructosidase 1-like n=1 Tax=Lycium ferocissimum TaxID=112874 RepID=UPI00281597B9|nr:cell wall / vacuolar inhibitor of fructosidase 1-like [Lycium ferocissimum]
MKIFFPMMMLISMFTNKDNTTLIHNTCKNTPNYQLCISTLQSDPRSSDADITVLGLVMVDAVKKKTVEIMESIKELEKTNPKWKIPLNECSLFYYAVIKADVPEAVDGLKKGVPKFAEMGMDDTAVEAEICEYSFKENGLNSPLSKKNRDLMDLSNVAKSIIRMLL